MDTLTGSPPSSLPPQPPCGHPPDSHAGRSLCPPSTVNKSHQKFHPATSAPSNTSPKHSSKRRRKAEEERLLRVAVLWNQVRAEKHQERHEVLNQKVVLQRALISAQDRRSQLIRRQEEETKVKKLIEEKTKRQDTLADLQDKCRQSLALDHKSKDEPPPLTAGSLNHALVGVRQLCGKSLPASGSGSHRRAYVPASSSIEEVDNDSVLVVKAKGRDGSVPGHHRHRAGRHSNIRQKKAVHPLLANVSGHLSASQIWTTLWSGSVDKLLLADQRFPQDLKMTFGSHVRQGLSKFRKPVFRSFTQTEDVPDLNRLMDQSKLHQIRVLRHKTQLMYRSSQTNQDRTRILLFNNPLPSISDGDDGVIRFLPPATEDTDSVSSEASYMRWVKHSGWSENMEGSERNNSEVSENTEGSERKESEDNICSPLGGNKQSLLALSSDVSHDGCHGLQDPWQSFRTSHRHREGPRYHFLTEQEAMTTGAFLARLNLDNSRSEKHSDLQHQGQTLISVPSVKVKDRSILKQPSCDFSLRRGGEPTHKSPAFKASHLESPWQPLSLNALTEYKGQLITEGLGDFQQGRPSMWQSVAS